MATVKIDGTEHEVELADITLADGEIPTGFVTPQKMTTTIQAEKAKAKRSARTELLEDAEFKAEVLTGYGIELRDDGTVKGAAKDTAALEAAWKAKHLAPVESRLTEATTATEWYRARMLEADILAAATEAGVRPAMLKPAPGQKTAPIVAMLRDAFTYDSETDTWALPDGDGVKYTTGGQPAGAKDLFSDMLERGADIRTVQELLGYKDVRTTEIYTHVLNRGVRGVVSPLDGLGSM